MHNCIIFLFFFLQLCKLTIGEGLCHWATPKTKNPCLGGRWAKVFSLNDFKVRELTSLVVVEGVWPLLGKFWHINY